MSHTIPAKRFLQPVLPVTTQNTQRILKSVNSFIDSFGLKPFNVQLVNIDDIKSSVFRYQKFLGNLPPTARILVFSVYLKISNQQINNYIDKISKDKDMVPGTLKNFQRYLAGNINKPDAKGHNWAYRQTMAAINNLVQDSDNARLDTQVIDKFDNHNIDDILDLKPLGLESVAIVAIYPREEKLLPGDTSIAQEPKLYRFV